MTSDQTTVSPGEEGHAPVAPYAHGPSEALDKDTRYWAMGCHLASFALYLFPPAGLIAPLVLWLIKREGKPFVDEHGKAVVNFQISLLIYLLISAALALVLVGFLLILALVILHVVTAINGAVHAQNGEPYRYPLAIGFIK